MDLIIEFGPKAFAWILAAVGAVLARYVVKMVSIKTAREIILRAGAEIRDAVTEVSQTYVDAVRRGRSDGKLTDEEAAEAKRLAWESFYANFGGAKALKRLARVLGLADAQAWVESKLEVAVNDAKRP
jgi:hypothetical protein